MQEFTVTVRLDSPMLQGGPSVPWRTGRTKGVDLLVKRDGEWLGGLRAPTVRGLMHTYFRALAGPLLGHDPQKVQHAERLLLGAQAGLKGRPGAAGVTEYASTFRVDVRRRLHVAADPYLNCPHDPGKGNHDGYKPDQTTDISVAPRASAVAQDRLLPAMLSATLWTGLALGSVGNRCRRGYGSLTIRDFTNAPALPLTADASTDTALLPVFGALPDEASLTTALRSGLQRAVEVTRQWLTSHGLGTEPWPGSPGGGLSFFQVIGLDHVYIGGPVAAVGGSSDIAAMSKLMSACSAAKSADAGLYNRTLGTASGGGRLASPLWVRLYRLADGTSLPVATFSPIDPDRSAADAVLRAIGAWDKTAGRWRTL